MRAKEGCGTNPVLCWAGLPDFLQTEGVGNGIITAEGVSADVDDRQSYIRRADRGGQRRAVARLSVSARGYPHRNLNRQYVLLNMNR